MKLKEQFTSTGSKLGYHQDSLAALKNQQGNCPTCHLMPTDICQYHCDFCSVKNRGTDVLNIQQMEEYIHQLLPYGLKSVILSGGGNPILWRNGGNTIADLIIFLKKMGLEVGLITNGAPLIDYGGRKSYKHMPPEILDMLTWIRISLAGWDHDEECQTPDIGPGTTLGGSWVYHHQKLPDGIVEDLSEWVDEYNPEYVRLLPDCTNVPLIDSRVKELEGLAGIISPRVFVQHKPPRQPNCACYKGYLHPVLAPDGFVYSCDSVVLNAKAGQKFAEPWRICKWDEVGEMFSQPIKPLAPENGCPGCVFHEQVELIDKIQNGSVDMPKPGGPEPAHVNFI